MTPPTKSYFNINQPYAYPNRVITDATVNVEQLNVGSKQIGLSFGCKRYAPYIDPRISAIYTNAILGKAAQDMTYNSTCPHNKVTSSCGNQRRHLSECRCKILDRIDHPEIRFAYENQVISAIYEILKENGANPFHLKLGIFCSGELLGEQILLFRLLNELNKSSLSGHIELFLIDRCYNTAIENSYQGYSFEQAVGNQKYIAQFLEEICYALPQNITVSGTFFDEADTYISTAQSNPNFKHHLLIGADIEKANFDMGRIGREAGLGKTLPITLVKAPNSLLCQLDGYGNLRNCFNPNVTQPTLELPPKKTNHKAVFIGAMAFLITGLFLFMIYKNFSGNSRRKHQLPNRQIL